MTTPVVRNTRAVEKLRAVMLKTVTDADIEAVTQKLIALAKGGDVSAAKLLFDRCLGKPSVGPQTPSVAIQQNFASESPEERRRATQAIVARVLEARRLANGTH